MSNEFKVDLIDLVNEIQATKTEVNRSREA